MIDWGLWWIFLDFVSSNFVDGPWLGGISWLSCWRFFFLLIFIVGCCIFWRFLRFWLHLWFFFRRGLLWSWRRVLFLFIAVTKFAFQIVVDIIK